MIDAVRIWPVELCTTVNYLKAHEKAVYELSKAVRLLSSSLPSQDEYCNFSSDNKAFPLPAFKKLNRCQEKGRIYSGLRSKRPMRRVAWLNDDCSLDQNSILQSKSYKARIVWQWAVQKIFMELRKVQMTMH
jgi:hypothetical protein